MSASDKKKLRKEQTAAAMTERQQAEQKKQKKQKVYTTVFAIAMILVVAIVLFSVLSQPVTRMMIKNTDGAKVNDHTLSATELNYFYIDAITNLYNQFSDYSDYQDLYVQMSTGWNPTKPLDQQTYDAKTGDTWADHFLDEAISSAEWTYTMYDAAIEEGYELSEEDQKTIDSMISYFDLMAAYSGYSDATGYLRALYGTSADVDSFKEYYTLTYIASQYANDYIDSLEFKDEDFRTHEADKMEEFNSYSWMTYYVNATNYRTGGKTVTDKDGNEVKEYTDEEKKAAVEAAKVDADTLLAADITDLESLNKAISALEKAPKNATGSEYTDQLYSSVSYYAGSEEAVEWLTSEDRKEGDKTVIPYTSEDEDGNEVTNGYYVLYYVGCNDNNEVYIGTVRHLLVAYEEDKEGNVTDEAKKAAREEAEKLLAAYEATSKTEEEFVKLLEKNTDDVDSNGKPNNDGLYSDITPTSSYVTEFRDWATAKHEKGDVEIVETDYGCHLMYYVSADELNYRDTMINNALINDAYEAWEEEMLEDTTSDTLETKYIDRDFIMSSGS